MHQTRKYFSHDELLETISKAFQDSLERYKISELSKGLFSNLECLKGGLALFTFKFSSLLKFDTARFECKIFKGNMKRLFGMNAVPCDTYLRERLDVLSAIPAEDF